MFEQSNEVKALRGMRDALTPKLPVSEKSELRRRLACGQAPFAIVLTCADSRVPPEHVFNAGLGELFVVRVAGNVCEPSVLASIEYAAEQLSVQLCVVMGHEQCGAVKAAAESGHGEPSAPMKQLLAHIEPSVRRARPVGYSVVKEPLATLAGHPDRDGRHDPDQDLDPPESSSWL